ncbi:aldose 1-epimerase [Catalinimonas alkaloidigena]|uniref:Aldose 1-epimerase n=2 Tax=Catalinimonas alkaloidigena TaxID=1075417 RepID=A0A1G9BKK9_9BACT|nr:aldose 1-epimerase [Catalinimonas alkaloidigena]
MFQQTTESFGPWTRLRVFDDATPLSLTILPAYGGALTELVLQKDGTAFSVLDGVCDPSELAEGQPERYKNSWLVPFANRVKDGQYHFGAHTYQLPINEPERHHALHGLVYRRAFEVVSVQTHDEEAVVRLEARHPGDPDGYPFAFRVEILYRLHAAEGFSATLRVTNESNHAAPLVAGWHPYFRLSSSVDELQLQLPACKRVRLNEWLVPGGRVESFATFAAPTALAEHDLNHCLALEAHEGTVETRLVGREATLVVWQEAGPGKFNYLQVFTHPTRTTVALEPMSGAVDAFNNGMGLIMLVPDEQFEAQAGVKLR